MSHWTENPNYPVSDWQYAVANGDTRESYSEWVENQSDDYDDTDVSNDIEDTDTSDLYTRLLAAMDATSYEDAIDQIDSWKACEDFCDSYQ